MERPERGERIKWVKQTRFFFIHNKKGRRDGYGEEKPREGKEKVM